MKRIDAELWLLFSFFFVVWLLGVLTDYAISSAGLVYGEFASSSQVWLRSLHVPYHLLVWFLGLLSFQYHGVLRLGVVAFFYFAFSVVVLFFIRLRRVRRVSFGDAFVDAALLYGGASLVLFEIGIALFDPIEIMTHATDFLAVVGLPFITNFVVLVASFAAFSVGLFLKLYRAGSVCFKSPDRITQDRNG